MTTASDELTGWSSGPVEGFASEPRRRTSDRVALVLFVVCLLAGAAVLLFHLGRHRWFFGDEWEFLATRRADDAGDLFRPHGGHWVTIPVLAFRAMWNVFGFHYPGYQAVLIGMHVSLVALLRVVMRRAGVGAWIATIASLGLLLFGAGEDNIVWAFQIVFVGALIFGIVHLLALDHDGPVDRRDHLGLAAGVGALMFSGVGVAMAVTAGIAALIRRRGWKVSLFHTLPPLACFAVWWVVEHPQQPVADRERSLWMRAVDVVQWDVASVLGAFGAFGYFPAVGAGLGIMLVLGLVLAWRGNGDERRRRAAVPAAMLAGALVFVTMTGVTRSAWAPDQAASGRYVYTVMALALPAVAIAADAIIGRWRLSAIPIVALLLVGVPGNVTRFGTQFPWVAPYFRGQQRLITLLPRAPEAALVDPDVQPDPLFATGVSVGWLREQLAAGRLPEPSVPVDASFASNLRLRLGVGQSSGDAFGTCEPVTAPIDLATRKGDIIGFRGRPMIVTLLEDGQPVPGASLVFNPDIGSRLAIGLDDLSVRLTPADLRATLRFRPLLDVPLEVCR